MVARLGEGKAAVEETAVVVAVVVAAVVAAAVVAAVVAAVGEENGSMTVVKRS